MFSTERQPSSTDVSHNGQSVHVHLRRRVSMAAACLTILAAGGACIDNDGERATPSASTFPPGTITPPEGKEINCGEYTFGSDPAAEERGDAFRDEHRCFL